MIVVVEPTYARYDHASVNASLLQAMAVAFPDEPIVFAASALHRSYIEELGALPTQIKPIDISVRPPGGVSLVRIFSQWRALRKIARAHAPRVMILLSSGPETFFAARAIATEFPALRLLIVLHGNLADAVGWRSRDPRHRILDFRSGLRAARHSNIKFVVLEDYIRVAAVERGLMSADAILTWPHPVSVAEIDEDPAPAPHDIVRIAFVGAVTRRKGFDKFLSLIRATQAESGAASKYTFSVIGASLDPFPDAEGLVTLPTDPLKREEFVRQLREIDYAVLLFDDERDVFTASGTLLDCVSQARPVMALDLAGVRSLMTSFGPIGFVCPTMKDIEELLFSGKPACPGSTIYRDFRDHLKNAALSRTPQITAALIRRDIGG